MAVTTLTGFYPYGSQGFNITNGNDVTCQDFHFQDNRIPGQGIPTGNNRSPVAIRNNPGAKLRGINAYIENFIPDDMDWNTVYDYANQCSFQVRDGCPNSEMWGFVVEGSWDGCKTPTSPGTFLHHCVFLRGRDDICEHDSGLTNFGDSYTWEDICCVGWRQGISTRPGSSVVPPGGHVITVRRSIFVSNQTLNLGSSDDWNAGIFRKTRGDVQHRLEDCVFAYDEEPTFQSPPTTHIATGDDTVTRCTFVWLGAGSVPTSEFGLSQGGQDWTIIAGSGAINHLGVTGAGAKDWLENYIVWWFNQPGAEFDNIRNTCKAKVNWSRVKSGNNRATLLPNLQDKFQGIVVEPPPDDPPPEDPYSGPTFYLDVLAASDGNGSFTSPFNSTVTAFARTYAPGESLLIKRGTVMRPTAPLVLKGSGTSGGGEIFLGPYGDSSLSRPNILGSPNLDSSGTWTNAGNGRWTAPASSDTTPETLWLDELNEITLKVATAAEVEAGADGTWAWISGVLHVKSGGGNPADVWASVRLNRLSYGLIIEGSHVIVIAIDVNNCHRGLRLGAVTNPTSSHINPSNMGIFRCSRQGVEICASASVLYDVRSDFHDQNPNGNDLATGFEFGPNSANSRLNFCQSKKLGGFCVRLTPQCPGGIQLDSGLFGGPGIDSPRRACVRTEGGGCTIRFCTLQNGRDPLYAALEVGWPGASAHTVIIQDSFVTHDGTRAALDILDGGQTVQSTRNTYRATGAANGVRLFTVGASASFFSAYDVLISDSTSVQGNTALTLSYSGNLADLLHATVVARGVAHAIRRRSGGTLVLQDSILYAAQQAPLRLEDNFGAPYVPPDTDYCLLYRTDGGAVQATVHLDDDFDSFSFDAAADGGETWAWYYVGWNVNYLEGNNDQAYKSWADHDAAGGGVTPASLGVVLHEVSGGTLKLYGRINPQPASFFGFPYLGGMITSEVSEPHLYGTWEVRAKLKATKGHHWSIWMVSTVYSGTGAWPEVDFVEVVDDGGPSRLKLFINSHGSEATPKIMHNGTTPPSSVPAYVTMASEAEWRDWHTYKFVWTPTLMEWWIDGVLRMSCANYIFNPMYVMVTPDIGGIWPGTPDGTTEWPMVAEIDYIRITDESQVPTYVYGTGTGAAADASGVPSRTEAELDAGTVFADDGYLQHVWTENPLFLSVSTGNFETQGGSSAVDNASDGENLGANQLAEAGVGGGGGGPGEGGETGGGLVPFHATDNAAYWRTTTDFGAGDIPVESPENGYFQPSPTLDGRRVGYVCRLVASPELYQEIGTILYDDQAGHLDRATAVVERGLDNGVEVEGQLVTFPAGEKEVAITPPAGALNAVFDLLDDGLFSAETALTFASPTTTWDAAAVSSATLTLTGNTTLNITGVVTGRTYRLRVIQDATGGRVLTWGTGVTSSAARFLRPTSTPNGSTSFLFYGVAGTIVAPNLLRPGEYGAPAGGVDPAADLLMLFDASAGQLRDVTPDGLGITAGSTPSPTVVLSNASPYALQLTQRAHLEVSVRSHQASVDFDVPATAPAGSRWVVYADHAGCTVSNAGGAGTVNGGTSGREIVEGGVAIIDVEANPGSAPVVTVSGNIFEIPVSRGAATATKADHDRVVQITGNQTFGAATGFPSGFRASYIKQTAGNLTLIGADATYTIANAGAVTVMKITGAGLVAVGSNGVVVLDAA